MNSNDWNPTTEPPILGQRILVLNNDASITTLEFPGMPFPRVVMAWQPWADPPAPDPFDAAFLKSGLDAKTPNVQNIFEAGWNAALAHAAATPNRTLQTFDEYWASLPLLGPRPWDKAEVRGLPNQPYCIEKEAARAVWNAVHAAATERPWKWETFEEWSMDGRIASSLRHAFNAARERKEA